MQAASMQRQDKRREIFIGSSSEGEDRAREIGRLLSMDPNTHPLMWREIFQPGFLTFEALEEMLETSLTLEFRFLR